MKNRKLLVSSFIMIISCCLLFAGTTFAWFSDSVTSNNNIITAGNLDVELEYSMDGTNWNKVDETVSLFNNSSWEPGHVEYVLLKVTNAGSLALKYSLALEVTKEVGSVNVNGEAFKLSDFLVVGSLVSDELDTTVATGRSAAVAFANANETGFGYVENAGELASKQAHYAQIAIVMPEETGNEANYDASVAAAPSIEFGVNLFATQLNNESDSFDENYDAGAPWLGNVSADWYFENPSATTYTLNSAAQLAGLAALVNGQTATTYSVRSANVDNSFAGKTIVLEGNVDLNGLNWEPIGNPMNDGWSSFKGTFDGNGYTISNLTVDNPTAWGQGLFGYLDAKNVVIKNLTVENATVNAEDTSGVVAGYVNFVTFENVHVTGDVKVTGYAQMGGIVGNGYYANFKNCSVVANEGSYISVPTNRALNPNGQAGGIVGYHGTANLVIEDCTVKNLTITAPTAVGAISGVICAGNTVSGCVVDNVVLNKTDKTKNPSIGLVAGTWDQGTNAADINITNNSFRNVTLNATSKEYAAYNELIGSNYVGNVNAVSGTVENNTMVNVVKNLNILSYVSNVAELNEASKANDGRTIVLTSDINEPVTFSGDVNFTLDLNGHTISGNNSDGVSVFNGANVTIKNGTLVSEGVNCGGVWVKNATLTLEGCTLIGLSEKEASGVYASNGANVTINDCTIESKAYGVIMMSADVTINSAIVNAPTAISSNGSDAYDKANLTINNGTFNGLIYWPAQGKLTINGGSFVAETALMVKSGSVEINGGTFVGNGEKNEFNHKDSGVLPTGDAVYFENVNDGEYQAITSVVINGGTFTSVNADAIASYSLSDVRITGFIYGGTFNSPLNEDLYAN